MDPRQCYTCLNYGHISRNCPVSEAGEIRCYRCHGYGHIVRECESIQMRRGLEFLLQSFTHSSSRRRRHARPVPRRGVGTRGPVRAAQHYSPSPPRRRRMSPVVEETEPPAAYQQQDEKPVTYPTDVVGAHPEQVTEQYEEIAVAGEEDLIMMDEALGVSQLCNLTL